MSLDTSISLRIYLRSRISDIYNSMFDISLRINHKKMSKYLSISISMLISLSISIQISLYVLKLDIYVDIDVSLLCVKSICSSLHYKNGICRFLSNKFLVSSNTPVFVILIFFFLIIIKGQKKEKLDKSAKIENYLIKWKGRKHQAVFLPDSLKARMWRKNVWENKNGGKRS